MEKGEVDKCWLPQWLVMWFSSSLMHWRYTTHGYLHSPIFVDIFRSLKIDTRYAKCSPVLYCIVPRKLMCQWMELIDGLAGIYLLRLLPSATKSLTHKLIIEKELHGFGIRLNQSPPDIQFKLAHLNLACLIIFCIFPLSTALMHLYNVFFFYWCFFFDVFNIRASFCMQCFRLFRFTDLFASSFVYFILTSLP